MARLMKGMDDYPKYLSNARVAPYDMPDFNDHGNEFQPMEPHGMTKRSNMLVPASTPTRSLDFGLPMESRPGKALAASGDASDNDVKQYICNLIVEDRARQLKRLEDEGLGADELNVKKKNLEEFADLCMAKVNSISARQETSVIPASDQFKHEETGRSVPAYLCDKWSHKIFNDPVITPSGHTYERSGIENHLKTKGNFDPVTRLTLTADLLVPNISMKQVVCAYMAENTHVGPRALSHGKDRKTIITEQSFIAAKRVRLSDE
ncbi:unnamed protein product [Allacma fusca]|uniref:RING-type E3 ubiquitin transferase n=1 Tax=Allacma fusca TaxID=39272 RepID=A0A8J2P3W6_9HEXA|nr:unnamed protein product [Allacma fusca]